MKTVPILAITNALALALAIFVYVKQGENQGGSRRSETVRSDAAEIAQLRMDIDELRRAQAPRGHTPEAAPDAPARGAAPADPAALGGSDLKPLASQPPEGGADPAAAEEEYPPQEMETFRKKVRKANELNDAEEQKNRIVERVDQLVKENKIAPLSPAQKENLAITVLSSRRKGMEMWRKLRENPAIEGSNREDRGRVVRQEMETLRTETQRSLEEFMPAADAKTYLDETMRDQMRGFGGFGGAAPQAPPPPGQGR